MIRLAERRISEGLRQQSRRRWRIRGKDGLIIGMDSIDRGRRQLLGSTGISLQSHLYKICIKSVVLPDFTQHGLAVLEPIVVKDGREGS